MAESAGGRSDARQKKRKKVSVALKGVPEAADRSSPIVGYFPTGYDPESSSGADPSVKLFRHKKRPNRLELLVSPSGSGVEFVGKSYAGEAAAAQLCSYALGVLDTESQTLKIVPIAANKILRLEPRLKVNPFDETEVSEGLAESVGTNKVGRKIADLTSMYGTKKARDKDNKWQSLFQQRNDPLAREHMESINLDADRENEVLEDTVESVSRNIPPYDPSADAPEKAYRLDEIILTSERHLLLDILEDLQTETDLSEKNYPSFVFNRLSKLRGIQDEKEKEKVACILSYINHLHSFRQKYNSRAFRYASRDKSTGDRDDCRTPQYVLQRLMRTFMVAESKELSAEKNELLIGYILVLTLFVDDFQTDPTDIAKDLQMTVHSLKPYYQQLGCTSHRQSTLSKLNMVLNVPLKFPEPTTNKRRR